MLLRWLLGSQLLLPTAPQLENRHFGHLGTTVTLHVSKLPALQPAVAYMCMQQSVRVCMLSVRVCMLSAMRCCCCFQVVSYELEHKTLLGSTDIRVVVEGGDYVVAVEVDGPFHYAQNRCAFATIEMRLFGMDY